MCGTVAVLRGVLNELKRVASAGTALADTTKTTKGDSEWELN